MGVGGRGAYSKHRAENAHKGENYLGRPRRKWKKKEIKLDGKETAWECMDWSHWVRDMDEWRAVVNTVMNFRVQ